MAGQTVTVSVLADTKKFSRAFKNLSQETGLSKLGNTVKTAGKAIAAGALVASAAIGALAVSGVKAASNLEQSVGGVDAVFKGNADTIHAWAKTASKDLGLSQNSYNEFATTIGSSLKNAGLPLDQVTGQTNKLIGLGSDLAAQFGGSTSESINAVGSALRGEFEPLRRYGVSLNQADINARAMADSGKTNVDQLTKQEKALATQALILDQTADAQGAFARESGTLAGATSRLTAQWENARARLGKFLLPIMTAVTTYLSNNMEPAFDRLEVLIKTRLVPAFERFAVFFKNEIIPAAQELAARFQSDVVPALKTFGEFIVNTVVPGVQAFVGFLRENKDILLTLAVVVGTALLGIQAYVKVMAIWRAATAAATAVQLLFNTALAANPIGLIILAVAALVAGLVFFFTQTELGKEIWAKAWTAIKAAVDVVVQFFQTTVLPALSSFWTTIQAAATAVANWYQTNIAPIFEAVGQLMLAIFNRVGQGISLMWKFVQPILALYLAGWKLAFEGIQRIWKTIGPPLLNAIKTGIKAAQVVWSAVWNAVKTVFAGVWNNIKIVVTTALGVLKNVIRAATAAINGDWKGAWNAIKAALSTAWNGIKSVVQNGANTVRNLISGLRNSITGIFSGAGNWLAQAGRNIIQGLLNGINSRIQSVRNQLNELTNLIPSWKGPIQKDRKLLKGAGTAIIDGLNLSLLKRFVTIRKTLGKITSAIENTSIGAPALAGTGMNGRITLESPSGGRGGSGNTYHITVQAIAPNAEVGRAVKKAIDDYERLGG